jgi:hypothetical protein
VSATRASRSYVYLSSLSPGPMSDSRRCGLPSSHFTTFIHNSRLPGPNVSRGSASWSRSIQGEELVGCTQILISRGCMIGASQAYRPTLHELFDLTHFPCHSYVLARLGRSQVISLVVESFLPPPSCRLSTPTTIPAGLHHTKSSPSSPMLF